MNEIVFGKHVFFKKTSLFLTLMMIVLLSGCFESKLNNSYQVSGRVIRIDTEEGLSDVLITCSNGASMRTNHLGVWSFINLKGTVTITPNKFGYSFDPPSITVNKEEDDLIFKAIEQLNSITAYVYSSSINSVIVSWTYCYGAVGARVERKQDVNDSYTEIADIINKTEYEDTGLIPGNTYYYRIKVYKNDLIYEYSNEVNIKVGIPRKPIIDTVVPIATTKIKISVFAGNHDNSFPGMATTIERQAQEGNWEVVTSFFPGPSGTALTYIDQGLSPNLSYKYRARSSTQYGDSDYSTTAQTKPGIPPAPKALSADAILYNQIKLDWIDDYLDESGFIIEEKVGGGSFSELTTVGQNIESYLVNVTSRDTRYYRVRAYTQWGLSEYSSEASATTSIYPLAPSNLVAITFSDNQIDLMWHDNSNDEVQFVIERKSGLEDYVEIKRVGPNTQSFSDTGLLPQTMYYYRIRAVNTYGYSGYSNEVFATTNG